MNKNVVEYVAELARIAVSDEEKESLGAQLTKILGYIDKLKELDVEGVGATSGVHARENVFRQDDARPSGLKEDILSNAPAREGDYFKIPKVIE